MKSYLREPLLHFVLLGLALFLGDALWERWQVKTAYTIHVSSEDMQRQASLFATENRREPNDEDLQSLLFAHVEEQVLMREARRIGLDTDDAIIRRRLAQKMRFMIHDVGDIDLPSEAVFQAWFEQNKSKFVQPETRDFEHIFFSPQIRDTAIETDALSVLAQGISEDWKSLGDPFIMARRFKTVSQAGVIKDFGRDFARDVFTLPAGEWSGPIRSALGLHLVRVTDSVPRNIPQLNEVREEAEALWMDMASRKDNNERLNQLIDKYNIVIDE